MFKAVVDRRSLGAVGSALIATIALAAAAPLASTTEGDPIRFARDIRPILASRCFACHGPDEAARKADLRLDTFDGATEDRGGYHVVAVGEPDASELLRRVAAHGSSDLMPPATAGAALTDAQVDILRRWITSGAHYEKHWAYVAPTAPDVPASDVASPVDAFVRAELSARGLEPTPEASRATLVRRLCLTLWGLPAPIELVERASADTHDDWYVSLVDELLAHPRYAEHMARLWLDSARYGDTHGLHLDNERSMWPYRDWVIAAFERNQPYDEFIVEQLAGDLLPEPTRDQLVATGFNRCNPTTAEGGLIEEEYLAKYAWDRVDTTSTVFLGLTMGCAKCHDHKFDPFTTKDYYALYSFFDDLEGEASDLNNATPEPILPIPAPEVERELAELKATYTTLADELNHPNAELDAAQAQWQAQWLAVLAGYWTPVAINEPSATPAVTWRQRPDGAVEARGVHATFGYYVLPFEWSADAGGALVAILMETLPDSEFGKVGRAGHGNFAISDLVLEREDGETWTRVALAHADADYVQPTFDAVHLIDDDPQSSWAIEGQTERGHQVRLELAEAAPPGRYRLTLAMQSYYDTHFPAALRLSGSSGGAARAIVLEPLSIRLFDPTDVAPMATAPDAARCVLECAFEAPRATDLLVEFEGDAVLVASIDDRDTLTPEPATSADALSRTRLHLDVEAGRHTLRVELKGPPDTAPRMTVLRASDALPSEAIAANIARDPSTLDETDRFAMRRTFRSLNAPEWIAKSAELNAIHMRHKTLDESVPIALVLRDRAEPVATHILVRGLYDHAGAEVASAIPAVFGELPSDAPINRLALARWIAAPSNPLAARVAVNRIWQQHFGRGLVATPEDFGMQGRWPSHPELLDWLATQFVAHDWDVHWLHHTILESATWRQISDAPLQSWRDDPDNIWLARGPRFRVDAEVLRDSALFAAGLLVERVGGASVRPYQPDGLWRAVAYPSSNTADYKRGSGDDLHRRSLYTFWKRTAPPASLSIFDAPSREVCTVRRERTNTPLQALVLLNDEQFVEAARVLATRVAADPSSGDTTRLALLFRTCLARLPSDRELGVLLSLLADARVSFDADPEASAQLIGVGEVAAPGSIAANELAAWTLVASTVLNLDEFQNQH